MSIARYFAKTLRTISVYPTGVTYTFSVASGYSVGQLDVFLNGVRLVSGDDYTATDGLSFTLTQPATVGDVVQYTIYPASPVSALPTSGGTITGDLTVNGTIVSKLGTAAAPGIVFSAGDNTGFFKPAADTLAFSCAGVERMRVDSTGLLSLAAGQIKFPASASISTNANTLDDYEEGTWTPTFLGAATNPTVTYGAARFGRYAKIGSQVFVQGRVIITATSGGSGTLRIGGLPFSASATNGYSGIAIGWRTGWTTQGPTQIYVEQGLTLMTLLYLTATGLTNNTTANLSASSDVIFGGTYMTDV